jgi:hypothetical protein
MKRLYLTLLIFYSLGCTLLMGAEPYKRAKPPTSFPSYFNSAFYNNAFEMLDGHNKAKGIKQSDTYVHGLKNKQLVQTDISEIMDELDEIKVSWDVLFDNNKSFKSSISKIQDQNIILLQHSKTLVQSEPDCDNADAFLKEATNMLDNSTLMKTYLIEKAYNKALQTFKDIDNNCNVCHTKCRL